jgi:predicted nucleic acid-binding Zn ribbon protein
MPNYDYMCDCGYRSCEFVWKMSSIVVCPRCSKEMKRLFTGSFAELKSKRSKPRAYSYDPREWDATKDNWEHCKRDYEAGKTDEKELKFWENEVKKENPDLVI